MLREKAGVRYTIDFPELYGNLLKWLLYNSPRERNARTNRQLAVGRGGVSLRIDLSRLPTCGLRKTFPRTAAAEVAWFLSGSRDVTWLRKYAPIWDKFVEADGVTIDAAYGYRWRKHFGRDQIAHALAALRRDSSDRRIYVSAWDPAYDGLGATGQKNVPCPTSFTLSIVAGELHSSLFVRSSDVFVGLPYDVMGHAMLVDAFATSLQVVPGVMTVTLAHPHLYEDHWELAEEALGQPVVASDMPLLGWSLDRIAANPDDYVQATLWAAQKVQWPAFNPKPTVVE